MQLLQNIDKKSLPTPADKDGARAQLEEWSRKAEKNRDFAKNPTGKALLESIFGNSPYLSQCITKEEDFFYTIIEQGFDEGFEDLKKQLGTALKNNDSQDQLMAALRIAKLRCALLVAIADISGIWPLEKITETLSEFAEITLNYALDFVLQQAALQKKITLKNVKSPSKHCGITVIALGKLGSRELNYSSDIDLLFLYDEGKVPYQGKGGLTQFCVRIVQDIAHILQHRTQNGYVFRVDLRLRPDPGSTPSAVALDSAELYYETVGQNWERAAMIKARPVAGDPATGERFMYFLEHYVWRKYLDFASIEDIHSIKRQIDSKMGELPENLHGYNIKLGHGGIREIEFYVQTQQLIWGGREPSLRLSNTCEALNALAAIGKISESACEDLIQAYIDYRTIEHRLQMVADQQTHTLPDNKEQIAKFAIFMGYKKATAFVEKLSLTLSTVKSYYARLFEQSPSLASSDIGGSLVFTGVENDPETLKTLERMGFKEPTIVSETVRSWHHGRRRATRTKKSRELLTELMPVLLNALSKTVSPDTALLKFDEFLGRLPSGVQIFSLFYAKPHLLDILADIMGGYPLLAEILSRKPALLEYVLAPEFYDTLPGVERLEEKLQDRLKAARDYQDILDITRAWAQDRQFRIGVQFIKHQITAEEASKHLSDIADVVLATLLDHVREDFVRSHGEIKGAEFGIIAIGKLGSRELTYTSDLDLIFIYDAEDETSGEYFIRLSRRFITAITSMTQEGILYEVDTRLRPQNYDGPMATSVAAFNKYYEDSAWAWEYMALTRARVIAGSDNFKEKISALIEQKLQREFEPSQLARHVLDTRSKIKTKHHTINPFGVKYVEGGLVDVETITQFVQLLHSNNKPLILKQNTIEALAGCKKAKTLPKKTADTLIKATRLFQDVQFLLRLTGNKAPEEHKISSGMKAVLAQALPSGDFNKLKKTLVDTQKKVQNLIEEVISTHVN